MKKNEYQLLNAARQGKIEDVKRMLDGDKSSININKKRKKNGYTALHYAAFEEHLDIVEVLLDHGTDINIKNKDGETPLDLARKANCKTVVSVLEKHINVQEDDNSIRACDEVAALTNEIDLLADQQKTSKVRNESLEKIQHRINALEKEQRHKLFEKIQYHIAVLEELLNSNFVYDKKGDEGKNSNLVNSSSTEELTPAFSENTDDDMANINDDISEGCSKEDLSRKRRKLGSETYVSANDIMNGDGGPQKEQDVSRGPLVQLEKQEESNKAIWKMIRRDLLMGMCFAKLIFSR